MANIPGATDILPGVVTDVQTKAKGVSVGLANRLPAIIGEGKSERTLVATAQGLGKDGLNASYTSSTGQDGRHFAIGTFPLIENRTEVYVNGIKLAGVEQKIDRFPFSNLYDYRLDPTLGRIEMQSATLVDQGGAFYAALTTNRGNGSLGNLSLLDLNAISERWSIRCSEVQRNSLGAPISGTAKFVCIGATTGPRLDKNGNPYVWVSDGVKRGNGVLEFSIIEGANPFMPGDAFVVDIKSGVLEKNARLEVKFIPSAQINDPITVQGLDEVVALFGQPSLENTLSLGAQLAFANGAPQITCVQAAPSLPARTSAVLTESMVNDFDAVSGTVGNPDNFQFPLATGVTVDPDTTIHFFMTNPATQEETQILPNKVDFNTVSSANLTAFIEDTNDVTQGGTAYCYTVVQNLASVFTSFDGQIIADPTNPKKAQLKVLGQSFDSTYIGKMVKVITSNTCSNIGTFPISSVVSGKLEYTTTSFADFSLETAVAFELVDAATLQPITGGSGIDGVLTPIATTATATLASAAIDFTTFGAGITTSALLRVNGSTSNFGLFKISAVDSVTKALTIDKIFISQPNTSDTTKCRIEVLDPADLSSYVVVNQSVVPSTYRLRITYIDARDSGFFDAGWTNALESLERFECDMVVPLPRQTISVIFQNTLSHCKSMSLIRNRRERVLLCGAINGLQPENIWWYGTPVAVEDIGILEGIQGDSPTDVLNGNVEDIANYSVPDAFGNTYRCIYFYPDQIVVQAGTDNVLVDGFYAAAAGAGYLAAEGRVETPLTNKTLSGFTILRNKMLSVTTMEKLAKAGVCILQPVSGGGRCKWGLTTTQSGSAEEQEISIVFIRDRIAKLLRQGFDGFIGESETPTTQVELTVRATQLLKAFADQGLITSYNDIVVKRDDIEPRQWNVSCSVKPSYPVNWVFVRVNVG
jgi:hypothetical protein